MSQQSIAPAVVVTTDATATPITLFPMPADKTMAFELTLVARAANGDSFTASLLRSAKRIGTGAPAVIGAAVTLSSQKDAGATAWTAVLGVSGNNLIATVTGALATTIRWTVSGMATVND